ncbi:MAG: VWA domain-containing protein [Candidatus Saccharibacteria bacterium]|nr:VWA domain-containing protein [Candidatus Saccharibacteria bacterium]
MEKIKRLGAIFACSAFICTQFLSSTSAAIEIAKTASELDADLRTKVTLKMPATSEAVRRDILLVLDASDCSQIVKTQVAGLFEDIKKEVAGTNEKVYVSTVLFSGNAYRYDNWTEISKYDISRINGVSTDNMVGSYTLMTAGLKPTGTNIPAGLLAAKQILEAETSTPDNKKTIFFLSDGVTYLFTRGDDYKNAYDMSTGTQRGLYDNKKGTVLRDGETWSAYFDRIGANIDPYVNNYSYNYHDGDYVYMLLGRIPITVKNMIPKDNIPLVLPTKPLEGTDYVVKNIDASLYQSNKFHKELADKYDIYTLKLGSEHGDFPWNDDFMDYLAERNPGSLDNLRDDFLELIRSESYIYDEIGYGDTYNFDTLNSPEYYSVNQSSKELEKTIISPTKIGFGEKLENGYEYEVEYFDDSSNAKEHLIWTINRAVQEYENVEFNYTLELTKCLGGEELNTNNFATLYEKKRNGEYDTTDFNLPKLVHDEKVGDWPKPEAIPPSPKTFDDFAIWVAVGGACGAILIGMIIVKIVKSKKK